MMKLGIVGSGMIVHDLLRFVHDVKGIELIHISGTKRSEEKLKTIQKEHHFLRYSTDYDELLNDEEVNTIYVAVNNHLHYEFALKALEHHKHVILEKPMTTTIEELEELMTLARNQQLFLWEAITNQYLPNYQVVKDYLPQLGHIKIVECNFSQYSSRYDAFLKGDVLPAFDYQKAGGALMDLNIYNIHFVVGLFGKPKDVHYYPNIEKNVDTSGILILNYKDFQCVCIGSKDCRAPLSNNIQGDRGCIHISSPVSYIESVDIMMNKEDTVHVQKNRDVHRMYEEFSAFVDMFEHEDYERCYDMLDHSYIVTDIQTKARRQAGLLFPEDDNSISKP